MLETLMPSPASSTPTLGSAPTMRSLAGAWMALAHVNAQAYADWLALCQETTARCALTRNVPECLTIGSLMLPSCLSHAMHYCRSLSEVVQAGLPAYLPLAGAQGGVAIPDGKAPPDTTDAAAR